jgi:hypothetical protein
LAIRFLRRFGKVRKFVSGPAKWRAARGQNLGQPEPQGVSHQKTASELAGSLAGLEVDQKSAANTCRQRKLILTHIQGFPSASDEGTKR